MPKTNKLVRVTSVLSYVESAWREYWWRKVGFEAADEISKESAEFGTKVHKHVETTLLSNSISYDITTPEGKCAQEIINYLTINKIAPLLGSYKDSLEIEVRDKKLGLIGHFDMAALVDGVPTVIDFKTSNKMRKSFALQKAAYAKMLNKAQGEFEVHQGLTIRSHWNKETQKVEFETKMYTNLIGKYWKVFEACLKVWMYFNRSEK